MMALTVKKKSRQVAASRQGRCALVIFISQADDWKRANPSGTVVWDATGSRSTPDANRGNHFLGICVGELIIFDPWYSQMLN